MLTIDAEPDKPKYIYLIKVKSTLIQALQSPNESNLVVPQESKSVLANRQSQIQQAHPHRDYSLLPKNGSPQGCVLGSPFYTLHTHDFSPTHPSNRIIKLIIPLSLGPCQMTMILWTGTQVEGCHNFVITLTTSLPPL